MRSLRFTGSCLLGLALAGLAAVHSAHATAAGPQPGTTGVPEGGGFAAEQTCIACHASDAMNPDDVGVVALRGVPETYAPGQRYALTFEISHPDTERMRWGFQLTAVSAETFRGAGHFDVTDARNTQVITGGDHGREYVQHTYPGTGIGIPGAYSWTFDWRAPDANIGSVAFYGGGNAANTDGSKEGDLIYGSAPEPLAVAAGPAPVPTVEEKERGSS